MISICIPIYNHYTYPMVRRLARQIASADADSYEIVCIDDHSSGYYISQNKGIAELATYVGLETNVGRAKIRNLFLQYAKGEYLLFLDCDSLVPENFVNEYAKTLARKPAVVVGGRVYDDTFNDREHRLRYLYGTKIESRPLLERLKNPYRSFMTNNFMVRRDVLDRIRFDESLTKYGHEDTLFGYRLEQNHIPILHIDNPVINGQVEENAEFLHKSVEAVENLAKLYDDMWEDQRFCHTVRLLNTYNRVRRMNLHRVVYWLYKVFKTPMESHFVSGNGVSLKQFNFYKLGTFIKLLHYNN
ncbi:MAG: glycosyltransferase family 2 protein [Bacteroidales bacterium]|nr:glycosyltransferase family 2 protein [Bacteroidales bacterium]